MRRCPSYKLQNCSEPLKCHLPNTHNITEKRNRQRKPQSPAQDSHLNEEHHHLPSHCGQNLHVVLDSSLLSSPPPAPHSVHHNSCCPFVQNISRHGQHLVWCIILILKPEPLPSTHEALFNSPLSLLNNHSKLCLRTLHSDGPDTLLWDLSLAFPHLLIAPVPPL